MKKWRERNWPLRLDSCYAPSFSEPSGASDFYTGREYEQKSPPGIRARGEELRWRGEPAIWPECAGLLC
jgi:hypothetical protein